MKNNNSIRLTKLSIRKWSALTLLFCMLVLMNASAQSQVPHKFNYQGIARDASGNPMGKQLLSLKISVLPTADATTAEYEETQTITTNEFGLYTLQIGAGESVVGNMNDVKWETGNKYIRVAIDPTGGTNYQIVGTNQLLSVPYALYADRAGNSTTNADDHRTRSGSVLSNAAHTLSSPDINYVSKFTAYNTIGSSSIYDNGTTVAIGTNTPSSAAKFELKTTSGNIEHVRMRNTDPNAFGKFILYNDGLNSYTNFTKYGTTYPGGYPGIAALYPYANLAAVGNNGLTSTDGLGRYLISSSGNIGISLYKGGISKLKFHADWATENVGIGGSKVPVSRVHFNNDAGNTMDLRLTNNTTLHSATDGLEIKNVGTAASITNLENDMLTLGTNNAERVRITAAGVVGVNTITPSITTQVDVNGTGKATGLHAVADQQTVAQTQTAITGALGYTAPFVEAIGVFGEAKASGAFANGNNVGVAGSATLSTSPQNNIGIMGEAGNAPGYNTAISGTIIQGPGSFSENSAIRGFAPVVPNSYAGLFEGKVRIKDGTEMNNYVFTTNSNGTGSWQDPSTNPLIIAATANDWHTSGNAGTSAGTNFLGTTDNSDLMFKRNNVQAGLIGSTNTSLGDNSLPISTSGDYNTAIGVVALHSNTSGTFNEAFGFRSLYSNSTGSYNSAFGTRSLNSNTIGNENVAIGHNSLESNTAGNSNTSVGMRAMFSNTTGSNNVAVGDSASFSNTTGNYNTSIGTLALSKNVIGSANIAVGAGAAYHNLADNNVAVGIDALYTNATGTQNTALGNNALNQNTDNGNTAVGSNAMYAIQTGINNTSLGLNAMNTTITGTDNTVIGANAQVDNASINATALGAKAYAPNDNTLILGAINGVNGASADTRVGIGTTAPTSTLHVQGSYSGAFQTTVASSSTDITLTDKDYVGYCVNTSTGKIIIPDPNTCSGRIYILSNQNATARTVQTLVPYTTFGTGTGYWQLGGSTISNTIPANGSITIMSFGAGGWVQIQ